ncbi:MAG: bacteriohemerythrin [Spongiibacteraceae bacterium]|jgi:hemerythrin|nr:bacteriohemerythrin [Spongiibacteraceae bacterium]
MPVVWSEDLNTGIDVIDSQHQRIVDYINQLEKHMHGGDRDAIKGVLLDLVDYTQSHFTFEESLQEEAGYRYAKPHQRVHQLFIRRINEYCDRFDLGQDIAEELHQVLVTWLLNHIRRDDQDYVGAVKENMLKVIRRNEERSGSGWLRRFFSL